MDFLAEPIIIPQTPSGESVEGRMENIRAPWVKIEFEDNKMKVTALYATSTENTLLTTLESESLITQTESHHPTFTTTEFLSTTPRNVREIYENHSSTEKMSTTEIPENYKEDSVSDRNINSTTTINDTEVTESTNISLKPTFYVSTTNDKEPADSTSRTNEEEATVSSGNINPTTITLRMDNDSLTLTTTAAESTEEESYENPTSKTTPSSRNAPLQKIATTSTSMTSPPEQEDEKSGNSANSFATLLSKDFLILIVGLLICFLP